MKRHAFAAAAMLLAAGFTPTSATDHGWNKGLDLDNADLSTFRLVLMNEGAEAGDMTYGWHKMGEQYVIEDRTTMEPNIVETAKAVVDGTTLLPRSVAISLVMGESFMNVDLGWNDLNRQGKFTSKRAGSEETVREVDLIEDNPAPLRLAVVGFVAAMPLDVGFENSFDWFNTLANRTETVKISVTGTQEVETPAGNFDTYVVEISGGTPENIVYVTKTKPRRIVRIDVVGRPLHFLLAANQPN
ncbi:hypothetical protein [Kordiimonas sp.]|uniref:DUF3108 domain-containing protein n=1 Tax=Kordiimonas sp. TaxID=1970157 RepID=UPI003A92340A